MFFSDRVSADRRPTWRALPLRLVAASVLATVAFLGFPSNLAHAEAAPITVTLTADPGADPYRVGARVDFRATLTCTSAQPCGVVALTVNLDPNVTYASHSVITANPSGVTTLAPVTAVTSASRVVFTVGSAAQGFGAGDTVTFPISARAVSLPTSGQLTFTASAVAAGQTAQADLVIATAGPGPNEAGKVSAGGCVWWDANRDGLRSVGDGGAAAVAVALVTGGAVVSTTTTDSAGCYSFINLDPSRDYQLRFSAPKGAVFTAKPTTGSGSVVDGSGEVAFTAPASGGNAVAHDATDLGTMDAGLVSYNLSVKESLLTRGAVHPGDTVRFRLVARNTGTSAALAGWRVDVILPDGLSLVSITGAGMACTGTACVADAALAAGGSSAPITVAAVVSDSASGDLWVVGYVRPAANDVVEAVPLGSAPNARTKTETTPTDNDARRAVTVSAAGETLAETGSDGVTTELALGVFSLFAGGGLLWARRRAAN